MDSSENLVTVRPCQPCCTSIALGRKAASLKACCEEARQAKHRRNDNPSSRTGTIHLCHSLRRDPAGRNRQRSRADLPSHFVRILFDLKAELPLWLLRKSAMSSAAPPQFLTAPSDPSNIKKFGMVYQFRCLECLEG